MPDLKMTLAVRTADDHDLDIQIYTDKPPRLKLQIIGFRAVWEFHLGQLTSRRDTFKGAVSEVQIRDLDNDVLVRLNRPSGASTPNNAPIDLVVSRSDANRIVWYFGTLN